jgi:hypothetical protein
MTTAATLLPMAVQTTRQLAGAIVADERSRHRLSQVRAAQLWGLGRPTLARLELGHDVSDRSYRHVEGALNLPRHFLAFVIAGDRERISKLPGLDEDLRQFVLYELEILGAPPKRRASDR